MAKVELKPGDFVPTKGMSEETYHKVAQAFMEAGADKGAYSIHAFDRFLYFGWANGSTDHGNGLYHSSGNGMAIGFFERQLTIAQVLGENDPAIGTCWEDPDDSEYTVEVVGYHNGDIICCDAKGGYSPYDISELTVPAKSEREKAVEEMVAVTDEHLSPEDTCRALYDAGYRKVE